MGSWSEHDRHRRSRPPLEGLVRLGEALGGSSPTVVRRLGGGLDSATHLLDLGERRLVVKRYRPGSDRPALEWQGLTFAKGAKLKAPAPVAVDQEGVWFGSPSLVMEAVRGHADLAPRDPATYGDEVASTMVSIHEADASTARDALLRPHGVDEWECPDSIPHGLLPRRLAGRAIETLEASLRCADRGGSVINHGDLHPGNVLWHRHRLSSVVDWTGTRLGPRWWEVGYFRVEAAVLTDVEVADALLRRYEAIAGLTSPDQPIWDLLCLYNGHRWGHLWLLGYQEQGRRDLTLDVMRRRLTRLTERVLATLGVE
jgi:aminoglycoside phosphotransferase (APT) family kinase protein